MWGKQQFSLNIGISALGWVYQDLGGTWDVCVPGFGC